MTAAALSGRRIIIVEDDFYQARYSHALLEGAGAIIVAIGSRPPDLAALLAQGPIAAALLDINLGEGTAFDFARTLRASAIPCLFLTGYSANILPTDLAATPCLSKPADGAQIVAALARLMCPAS